MDDETSPISFPVNIRRLPEKGFPLSLVPDQQARTALAAAQGLLDVEAFRAELVVRKWKRDGIRVVGTVVADIVQQCIVSLEPMSVHVETEVDATFVPSGSPLARPGMEEGEMFLSAEGPDAPEVFDGDTIDAGAVAEEFFALAIDPYPRKPGAALATDTAGADRASTLGALADRIQKN